MSLAIGVDVGGTKVAGGVVDEQGRILAKLKRSTPAASPPLTEQAIADVVTELLDGHEVSAIGLGAAGFVDSARATMLFAPNLAWRDEPLKQRVEERLGRAVVVENDANASAWAEARFGAARGYRDVMLVAVGTGIGAAIIIGGELYRGRWGIAGEPGHVRVVPEGRLCGCGNRGCWEQYASGNALVAEAREFARRTPKGAMRLLQLGGGLPEGISGPEITQAATEGDPAALRCFQTVGGWLGQGLADLAAILDPACFVIGGGVSEAGELLLEPARAAFERALTGRGHRPFAEISRGAARRERGHRRRRRPRPGSSMSSPLASGRPLRRFLPSSLLRRSSVQAAQAPFGSRVPRILDDGAVVAVVWAAGVGVVHAQDEDGETGHERGDRAERRQSRHRPARRRGDHQVARSAEQRHPGALGHRVQLGQRRRGGRDEVLLVLRGRPVRRDAARHRPPDSPRHLDHLGVMSPVGAQPPVPSGRPAQPARFDTWPSSAPVARRARRVARRPARRSCPSGACFPFGPGSPRSGPAAWRPCSLSAACRPCSPSAACRPGSASRPPACGPRCFPSLPRASSGPSAPSASGARLGGHILAGRPGHRLLLGQRHIEPGHKVTPRRILVAFSALGVIPVRHVSTAAYRSLPSTIAAPGPVPGG